MSNKKDLIIVGAGAAGLYAASMLLETFNITLIESRGQAGGRIRSHTLPGQRGVVEAGAEFVHGHLPITQSLIREAGLTTVTLNGKMYRKTANGLKEQDEIVAGWDQLLAKMRNEPSDLTLTAFLDKHYAQAEQAEIRRQAILYAEGFDLADPDAVSVKSLYNEWSNEEEQLKLKEGYGALVAWLYQKATTAGCRFLFNHRVNTIRWQRDRVEVITTGGKLVSANRLLVTVPPSILTANTGSLIQFSPAIPEQIAAFNDIGFGTVVKLVLEFPEPFWPGDTGFVFSDEAIPTWWTQAPLSNGLLTGWAGGPAADRLRHLSDQEIENIALDSLSRIFNPRISDLRNIMVRSSVFNWSREEDARGAYSFSTPKSTSARKTLNRPLANTLFFAGEALFEGDYPGTVEAAMKSGSDAAEAIKKSL